MTAPNWTAFTPWFCFAIIGVRIAARMLSTGRAWWFGKNVSRSEEPKRFRSAVRGVALAATGSAIAAVFSLVR